MLRPLPYWAAWTTAGKMYTWQNWRVSWPKSGHIVDVYTRKYEADQPEEVNWLPGIRVIHIKAGLPCL